MLPLIDSFDMKNTVNRIIMAVFAAVIGFCAASCGLKEPDYSGMDTPKISLMVESLSPDLNRVDNTPIVCVIFSEAGLAKVNVYLHEGDEKALFKEITEFNDEHQYSVEENPSWHEGITMVSIEAMDKGGRSAEASMDVDIIPIQPAPVITFDVDKIEIDERREDPTTVKTVFEVTSSNTLSDLKAAMFTADGVIDLALTPSFTPGSASYRFEQDIDYLEGYRGLQVTATDANGKMKIETLPVNYIPAPAPVITPDKASANTTLLVRSSDTRTFNFKVDTEVGLSYIEVLKVKKDIQGEDITERISIMYYDSDTDFSVDFSYLAESFDNSCHALRFVACDRLNHSTSFQVNTIVDMRLGENIVIASQCNTKEPLVLDGYEGESYCFFSVKDFKTYSLFDFWKTENRRNIDFFYFAWNAAGSSDNGTRIMKASEDRAGQDPSWFQYVDPEGIDNIPLLSASESSWSGRNATYIKRLTDAYAFDFDNVTVADLISDPVQSYIVQNKTNDDWINYKAGDCFLFKTGPLSTCPDCTGIVRVEEVVGSRNSFTGDNPDGSPVYIVISIKAQITE